MKDDKGYESVLPPDFDGTFRFTNPSDEDFVGIWNKKEYHFPAQSTVPMVMPEHSPIEIQHIRKKFAKDLAEREFYKSKGYKTLQGQEGKPGNRLLNSIHQAAAYNESDLEPFIQACLKSLPLSQLLKKDADFPKVEDKLHRKDDGTFTTEAIDKRTSLKQKALES